MVGTRLGKQADGAVVEQRDTWKQADGWREPAEGWGPWRDTRAVAMPASNAGVADNAWRPSIHRFGRVIPDEVARLLATPLRPGEKLPAPRFAAPRVTEGVQTHHPQPHASGRIT
jgi:hypothetical protein